MRFTKSSLYFSALWTILLFSSGARAYEEPIHRIITGAAVSNSVLQLDQTVLQNMGLTLNSTFPNTDGTVEVIPELFRDGAEFEDGLLPFITIRSLRHFYNPITGLGLDIPLLPTQVASPDWALAAPGSISGQESSYWDARKSLFTALTDPSEAVRQAAFGETFQYLGQVVHHLQDMAQPQHVRNDVHCDKFVCTAILAFAPSRYEKWATQLLQLGANIPTDFSSIGDEGFSIIGSTFTSTFNRPRSFWNTEPPGPNSPVSGKGIAEFTNRNFVSAGTNFGTELFPSPALDLSKKTSTTIQELCLGATPACPPAISSLPDPVFFYGTTVHDNFLGLSGERENQRASTSSIFDQDLAVKGLSPVFSLNRFNFEAAYGFLIPRAVAYSAGMINYFFRGKIDLVPDDTNPGTFLIKNLGNEPVTGDFALYYDNDAGSVNNRTLFIDWGTKSIPANDRVNIGTISDPTNPAPKNPGEFILVFKGNMGAETTADFGAVVGKIVNIQEWIITDLGTSASSGAYGINKSGQVVGFDGNGGDLWSLGSMGIAEQGFGSCQDAFTLPSIAFSINASGQVAGVTANGFENGAFFWSGQSGCHSLDFGAGKRPRFSSGINDSGQVVGMYLLDDPTDPVFKSERAFIWTIGSGMQDLGTLDDPAGSWASALSINNSGQVAGWCTTGQNEPTPVFHAIRWSGGLQDLGKLPGWGNSRAFGINDNGQVVGNSFTLFSESFPDSFADGHAFLWSGGMQDLGTLPGWSSSIAYGINNSGQVVGISFNSDSINDTRAFLWSSRSGMQDLSTLPAVVAAGWSALLSARAINDTGQIVGWGTINGQVHAFLLTPRH